MKRILVTGGAGFIGSAFVRYQLRHYPDAHIVNLDKLTYAGNLENLSGIDESRHGFFHADVCDADKVREAAAGCEAIVHFAAETHVDRSLLGGSEFIATNIGGTAVVLEAARALGVSRVVLISTDEVYGSATDTRFREEDPLRPRNPYAASKAAAEHFGNAAFESFGLPVIITRGSNTFGPYQYPEKMIPLFVTNALERKPLPVYGDGMQARDWLYVDDHCSAIDYALRHGKPGCAYNIPGENEHTNMEVAQLLLQLLEAPPELLRHVPDRPGHDRRYAICGDRIRALGWRPSMAWEDALANTVSWYRQHECWWRAAKEGAFQDYYNKQYGDRGERPRECR